MDGARLLRDADLDQRIDPEIEEHLIELCFTWHTPCNPAIDRSMYWNVRKSLDDGAENNGYYSEVLTNAM